VSAGPVTVRLPRALGERLVALTREVGAHNVRELVVAAAEVLLGEDGATWREAVRRRLVGLARGRR
jgi:hypothetical protein